MQAWDVCEIAAQTLRALASSKPQRRSEHNEQNIRVDDFAGGLRDWSFVEFGAIIGSIVRAAQVRLISRVSMLLSTIAVSWGETNY